MTLQEQFNAIKNGKGNKVQFLKQARSLFPQYLNQYSDFNTSVNVLKSKQIINEAVGGVVTKGFNITNWKQIFEAEAKAEEKTTSKEAADANKSAYQPSNVKNADNINFNEILKGYLAELGDVKNAGKTGDELKEIAVKNLAKDPLFYTKNGEFGIKGVGYTTEAPGLGEPKEAKGKHKSSGYGDIDKEIKVKANVKDSLGSQEAKDSMPKKVKEMPTTPQSSAGVKKMKMPGAEKKMKLQENKETNDKKIARYEEYTYTLNGKEVKPEIAFYDNILKAELDGEIYKIGEPVNNKIELAPIKGKTGMYTESEFKLRSVIAKLIKEELKENLDAKYSPDETYKYAVECKYIIGFEGRDDVKYFKSEEEAKDYAAEKPIQRKYVGINGEEVKESSPIDLRSDKEKKLSKLFDKKPEDLKNKYQKQKNSNSSIFPKKESINSNLNESKLRFVIAKLIKEELKRSNISGSEYIEINGKVVRTYVQNGDKSYSVEYDDGTKDIIAVSNDAWSEINDLHMNATNLNESKLRSVIAKLIKEELDEDESDLDARLKKYVENEVPTGDWKSIKNYYKEMTQDKPDPKRRYFELVDGILKKHGY
jgi:hypothetical protein